MNTTKGLIEDVKFYNISLSYEYYTTKIHHKIISEDWTGIKEECAKVFITLKKYEDTLIELTKSIDSTLLGYNEYLNKYYVVPPEEKIDAIWLKKNIPNSDNEITKYLNEIAPDIDYQKIKSEILNSTNTDLEKIISESQINLSKKELRNNINEYKKYYFDFLYSSLDYYLGSFSRYYYANILAEFNFQYSPNEITDIESIDKKLNLNSENFNLYNFTLLQNLKSNTKSSSKLDFKYLQEKSNLLDLYVKRCYLEIISVKKSKITIKSSSKDLLQLSKNLRNAITCKVFIEKIKIISNFSQKTTLYKKYQKALSEIPLSNTSFDFSSPIVQVTELLTNSERYNNKKIVVSGKVSDLDIIHKYRKAITHLKITDDSEKEIFAVLPYIKIDSTGLVKNGYVEIEGTWDLKNKEYDGKAALSIAREQKNANSKTNLWSWIQLETNQYFQLVANGLSLNYTLELGRYGAMNPILFDVYALNTSTSSNIQKSNTNARTEIIVEDTPSDDNLPPIPPNSIPENLNELEELNKKILEVEKEIDATQLFLDVLCQSLARIPNKILAIVAMTAVTFLFKLKINQIKNRLRQLQNRRDFIQKRIDDNKSKNQQSYQESWEEMLEAMKEELGNHIDNFKNCDFKKSNKPNQIPPQPKPEPIVPEPRVIA